MAQQRQGGGQTSGLDGVLCQEEEANESFSLCVLATLQQQCSPCSLDSHLAAQPQPKLPHHVQTHNGCPCPLQGLFVLPAYTGDCHTMLRWHICKGGKAQPRTTLLCRRHAA